MLGSRRVGVQEERFWKYFQSGPTCIEWSLAIKTCSVDLASELFQVFPSGANVPLPLSCLIFRAVSNAAKTWKEPASFLKAGFWRKDVLVYLQRVHNDD